MSKSSQKLYELIHALDKHEKRYFKIYTSRYQKKNEAKVIQLFDYIAQAKTPNEDLLKQKINDEKLLSQFSYYKNLLYSLVLKMLSDYYYMKTPHFEEMDSRKMALILFSKGLNEHAEKLMIKPRAKALKRETFLDVVEFNRLQVWILKAKTSGEDFIKKRHQLYQETLSCLQKETNYQEIENIASDLYNFHQRYTRHPKKEIKEEMQALLNNPLIKDKDKALSLKARLQVVQAKFAAESVVGESMQTAEEWGEIIEKMRNNMEFSSSRMQAFIGFYLNYITALIYRGKYAKAKKVLQEYKEIPTRYPDFFNDWLIQTHRQKYIVREALLSVESRDFKKFDSMQTDLDEIFSDGLPYDQAYMYYFLIKGTFLQSQYEHCQDWILRFMHDFPGKDFMQSIQGVVKLTHALVHFERGNEKLFRSLLNHFYRYCRERNIYEEIEQFIHSSLIKVVNTRMTNKEKIAHCQATLNKLKPFLSKQSLLIDIYIFWLERRIKVLVSGEK